MSATPEFSRPYRLGNEPKALELAATPAECAALARRFSILGIAGFTASLSLKAETGGTVRARGRLHAAVTQECIVTLDPVDQVVDAAIDLRILPDGVPPTDDDPDSPDEIESAGGFIDLGEAAAEQLALALDPYPRRPDAALPPELDASGLDAEAPAAQRAAEPSPGESRPNPFAALARLKRD
ncbi:YceD family protein [Falsiroseomonas ponticola]|uniref:YceD family protein n=1 Tax=Falsiroseomonas ponticola TaxID=2786951 RepID=UPI001932C679|nr:YceD family protein [Roseomonas ponticola]